MFITTVKFLSKFKRKKKKKTFIMISKARSDFRSLH